MHRLRAAIPMLLWCVGAAAQTPLGVTPLGAVDPIPATLYKPDGDGPFPAIVVLHDCSGLGPRSSGAPGRWTRELLRQGYVLILPDSFTPRGLPNGICTLPAAQQRGMSVAQRAADAHGALAVLRALPYVDAKRIGVMGGSNGGSTTLAALVGPANHQGGFAAAIALYPSCAFPYGEWSTLRAHGSRGPAVRHSGVYRPHAPLLILIGEKDDWTPAEPCLWLAEASRAAGYAVDIRVYAGAQHSFDSAAPPRFVAERNNATSPTGRGATTGGDPAAWAEARREVAEFFARHLGKP